MGIFTDIIDNRNKPKRGLVDEPGSYGGERAIPRTYIDGITVSETLDGKKTYYAKVKVGDEIKSFSDSSLEKVKKWKEKNSAIAKKKGYGKRDTSLSVEQTKKRRAKEAKKTAKARANIDKWTKNWLNKNLNKYDVRELDLFKKELVEDWAKELKKNPNLYVGKSDFKPTFFEERTMTIKDLPNLTGSSISNKPFKYGPRVLGDKATIETTLNKIFYDNKLKDKNFKNKVKNYMQHFLDGKPHGNNVVARNAYDSKTAKLLDDDVLYLLSAADSKLMGSAKQAVLVNALGNVYTDYRKVTNKMGASYLKNSQLIDEFLGGTNLIAKASVREHNALKKIFDVSELPLTLRYNIDHMYGISEAAREITNSNPSKARVKAILNNTMGMTQKRNFMLGTEGYSFRRKSLINKINAGKDVDANLLKLNEATKAAYNVDNAYEIKQGKATPSKSFVGQTQKERFQSYFEEIYKTPQGKKQIIKQAGGLKQIIAKLSPNKVCAVGRRAKAEGGGVSGLDQCFEEGMRAIKEGKVNKPHQVQGAKQLMNAGKRVGANKFVNILTNLGIVGEVAFIAGDVGIRQAMGRPFYEAFLAATFRGDKADLLRRERAGGASKELQEAERLDKEIANLNSQIENIDALGDFYTQADKDVLIKRRDKLLKEYEPYRQYMTSGSMKNISDRVRTQNIIDSDRAKSLTSKLQLRDNQLGIPNIADYDEVDAGVSEVRPKERSVLPSSQQAMIDNTRRQLRSLQIDESQMSDKTIGDFINNQFTAQERMQAELEEGNREEQVLGFNPDKSLEIPSLLPKGTYIPRPGEEEELLEYMSRVQGAKDGGLMNLTETTPPKRSLNKDSQGLASLPEYDR